jgi:hypothetical protein
MSITLIPKPDKHTIREVIDQCLDEQKPKIPAFKDIIYHGST